MARVRLSAIIHSIRGSVGDLVFRRYGDRTVVSKKPDFSNREFTPAQIHQHGCFRKGVDYGNRAKIDPELWARYRAKGRKKGQSAFSLTIQDYLNPPRVEAVGLGCYAGRPGDPIVVEAWDDFEVADVDVVVTSADGTVLEEGAAEMESSGYWVYAAKTAVPVGTAVRITATARDHPGTADTLEAEITVAEPDRHAARRSRTTKQPTFGWHVQRDALESGAVRDTTRRAQQKDRTPPRIRTGPT